MSDAVNAALDAFKESGSTGYDNLGNQVYNASDVGSDTGDSGDAGAEVSADAPVSDSGDVSVEATAADPAAPAAPVEQQTPQQDEIDRLLQAEGVEKQSVRGENRIPYSRTKKIIENAQTSWAKTQLEPVKQELEQHKSRLSAYQNQEQLAAQDPDRFIAALAAVDPRYAKFLGVQNAPAAAAQPPVNADPEPQPLKDEQTGQLYYTPERWAEVQAWNRRQAVREAKAELDKEYGTVLKTQKEQMAARAEYEKRVPVVQRQMQRLHDTYGAELVKKHEGAIVKAMQADPTLTPAEAAMMVLTPVLRADEAAVRAKVLSEMGSRPAAAKTAPAAPQRSESASGEPKSVDDQIREQLAKAYGPRR